MLPDGRTHLLVLFQWNDFLVPDWSIYIHLGRFFGVQSEEAKRKDVSA